MRWGGPVLGIVAVLSLLGLTRALPPEAAFLVGSLAVILFPGMAVCRLIASRQFDDHTLPERLALWFVMGAGVVAAAGLLGLLLQLRLRDVALICVLICAALTILLIVRGAASRQTAGTSVRRPRAIYVSPVGIVLLIVAVGLALITLITPRDYDDWYYLAHIKDYSVGSPLGSEDAIFDRGNPVSPRIWFGGGWWVLEALLARISDLDPITCHQIYLPILLLPFAVLAVFTLSRRLFRSAWMALLASGFQMLFYLSSAYPFKSTGWMIFARMAQDKTVACFIVVPVAAALALRLLNPAREDLQLPPKGLVVIYWMAVITSLLVHGMGPVWCGLFVVPFALVEWAWSRSKASARASVRAALPVLACAVILISLRGLVDEVVTAQAQNVIQAPGPFSAIYLPGMPFNLGTETTNPVTWIFRESFRTVNPLFIVRYPLAIAGLVLTFAILAHVRRSMPARFLLSVTLAALLLLFTPFGVDLTARFITQRLAFRPAWVLPWGLIIAFFLARLRLRPFLAFLMLAAVILALARGDPRNYVRLFGPMYMRNRPSSEAVDAFAFLGSRPAPQGVILATEVTGRMIPAFLPEGYPVNFRELGPVSRKGLKQLVERRHIDEAFVQEIERLGVRYIMIESGKPLEGVLKREGAGFLLRYENAAYSIWERATDDPAALGLYRTVIPRTGMIRMPIQLPHSVSKVGCRSLGAG